MTDIKKAGLINHPDAGHHASILLQENFPDQFNHMSDVPVRGYVNQINLILIPVMAGLGVTVLPVSVVEAFPDQKGIQIMNCLKQFQR